MKRYFNILVGCLLIFSMNSCLYHNLEDLENSSDKKMTNVDYSYRFLYNDTIQKGTANQEILEGRVCEVIFSKSIENVEVTVNSYKEIKLPKTVTVKYKRL